MPHWNLMKLGTHVKGVPVHLPAKLQLASHLRQEDIKSRTSKVPICLCHLETPFSGDNFKPRYLGFPLSQRVQLWTQDSCCFPLAASRVSSRSARPCARRNARVRSLSHLETEYQATTFILNISASCAARRLKFGEDVYNDVLYKRLRAHPIPPSRSSDIQPVVAASQCSRVPK